MKLLLADADADERTRMASRLGKRGYDVLSMDDGQSALTHLLCSEEPWVALIDAELPEVDGLTVCRKIRSSELKDSVYVILRGKRPSAEEVVRGLGAGADDYLSKTCPRSLLNARLRLAERVLRTRYALAEQALHDPLTALPNRAFVIDRLAACVRQAGEDPDYRFTFLLINIDRFKVINDSLGHAAGNILMKKIARRLIHSVRTRPAGETGDDRRGSHACRRDTVARLDGDEFVILLEQIGSMDEGIAVANRVNQSLHRGFFINGEEIIVTASIGIAMSNGAETDASELLRGANAALDRAKLQGRARYEINTSVQSTANASQLKLEHDLRYAVERGELEVHYQPIVDLSKAHITRFEALLRWKHPKRGFVPPSTFIPLAEDTGLILPIGSAVLRAACQQMKMWNSRFSPATSICINISPRQFLQSSFVEQVEAALQESGLDATSLELEVTENLTMNDVQRAEQVLKELVGCGVSVSLDDFGTGYSSLSYLLKLPIQTLKIDRSFVSRIEHSSESVYIIQTIIALGHNLGMKVTAEGIETEAQLALLQQLKCDFGQGYLFSPALDAVRATEVLTNNDPSIFRFSGSSPRVPPPHRASRHIWTSVPAWRAMSLPV